jgi:acetyl esterase/lipase
MKPQSSAIRKHRNTALFALFAWSAIAVASSHVNVQSEEKAMTNQQQPILESKTQAFIDAVNAQGGKPLYELSYAEARKVLETAQAGEVQKMPADVEDRVLPVGPTGEVSVTIYRPKGSTGLLPVVMYFHGGGWVLGSKHTHDRLLRDLVNGTNATFVFVNYTPSPEAQFPVPIEQDYAATKYIAEHGKEFGLDTSRLAVAGDSVGGNMVAVVTQLAKERKGPAIRYQVLFYPVTDASLSQKSYEEFAKTLLSKMKHGAYLVNTARAKICDRDAIVCALTVGQLAGYAGDVWFPQPTPADHPWWTMPYNGMTPHVSGTSLSAQTRYAAGTREILECRFENRPIRQEYLIASGEGLAGTGAHS